MQRVVTPRAAITGLALVVLLSLLSMAAAQQGAEQRQLQQQEQQLTNAAADVNSASGFYPATFNKPTPPPTEFDPSDPFTTRQTVYINLGGKKHTKTFPLRFPRLPPLPPGVPTYIRLNVTDTCGLFTLFHTVHQAEGAVVPPHIHYAEDEYFIFAGTGSTRLFTSQKATQLKPGRLPGFNSPPIEIGSTVLSGNRVGNTFGGQLVLSPAGNVHYFERVTNVTDVFTVYLDGFADADVINYVLYGKPYTPRELLLFSGLYGIPTDMTGAFVKGFNDSTGEKQLYRNARGPIDVPDAGAAVRRLQQLFDYVEKYNCCKACL